MKQKSDWKTITLLRKASFKKEIKILAANKRQTGNYPENGVRGDQRVTARPMIIGSVCVAFMPFRSLGPACHDYRDQERRNDRALRRVP
jgi:hypothetical protein